MATSIGKLSKSFFVKLLVGIIILPFVFWGMGDVFRGGNQNVIATVASKKISTQEFVNYIRQINLNEEQIKSLPNTNLIEQILSQYIGRKVMALEINKSGIVVSDNALRSIIKNDKQFYKDNKFSRTKYEKFLIKSRVTAPQFEANVVEQEKRRQFLSSLAGGIVVPEILVENLIKYCKGTGDIVVYNKSFESSKKGYEFLQNSTTNFLGNSNFSGEIRDVVKNSFLKNQFFLEFNSKYILGTFRVKSSIMNYSYGYDKIINQTSGITKQKLAGSAASFGADWKAKVSKFQLDATGEINPGSARLAGTNLQGNLIA